MRKSRTAALAATVIALAVASGCSDTGGTNAGLTNGPPPASAGEKAAVRTDVPAAKTAGEGETLGRTGDQSTNAGAAGSGGGGSKKDDAPRKSDSDRANPPAKGSPDGASAAGGTKPGETIKDGTSKSPQ